MDVSALHKRFQLTLRQEQLISPGDRVLVALSGGADSMALLILLLEASKTLDFEVRAAHLDHALRPESRDDADFVTGVCGRLGVALTSERQDVARWAKEYSIGVEEAGRKLRYDFLEHCSAEYGCTRIALGHHRQDQGETLLHRLVRGSGLAGLAAMRLRRGLIIRPLLTFDHSDLVEFLEAEQIEFREDASNLDPAFTRNYLRHEVVPRLRRLNPNLDEALEQTAAIAAAEEDYWEQHLDGLSSCLRDDEGGWSVPGLLKLHPAELSRLLLCLLKEESSGQIGTAHVLAVERMLRSEAPQGEVSLPGVRALRRYQRLLLSAGTGEDSPEPWQVDVAGVGHYPVFGGAELIVEESDKPQEESRWAIELPYDVVVFPLTLRPFLPGDRVGLEADAGHKKIKKLFAEIRLERESRSRVPLLIMGEEVLWVPGLRRTGKYVPEHGSGKVVRISLENPESIESLLVKRGSLC